MIARPLSFDYKRQIISLVLFLKSFPVFFSSDYAVLARIKTNYVVF